MSAVTFASISAALNQKFEDELASVINRACIGARLISKKSVSGKNVGWVARLGTTTATAESDGASISTYNSDTKAPATLDVGTYQDTFKLDGRAVAGAANSGGPNALVDLFGEHVMESLERIASKINTDLYSGTGATSDPITIAGLNTVALLADTGTYANISRNTYAQWKSNVLSNSSVARPLTVQLMRDMMRTIYVASGFKPNLILCDPFQHEQYGLTFGPFRRYLDTITVNGETIRLDAGYKALEFDGVPVIEDKDAVAGTMDFIDTKTTSWRILPPAPMQARDSQGSVELAGSETYDGAGMTGIPARIQELARDGDFRVFQVLTYLQLQVKNPNRSGVLKDLATS